ncbi:isoleucine--tRNA ligase, cytoplasmic-like isoform X1 [Pogoniulus pusillus]|uniref:isoleucine--tRNA ligase, cytoplasmic-like isoform X1 n=1 Tax=Pogoniulus pusillus TaxID=488313 RepID=UPI0030B98813
MAVPQAAGGFSPAPAHAGGADAEEHPPRDAGGQRGWVRMVQQVPENISFPHEEEKILELWKNLNCFQEWLKQSKNRPRFNSYDGPPFAAGLPHYGHVLAGAITDIVTRFAHQSGFHVDRRFGWACHGFPVCSQEYEIDKTLGIKGPEDVAKLGSKEHNNQCRGIVMRYSKEWELPCFSVVILNGEQKEQLCGSEQGDCSDVERFL